MPDRDTAITWTITVKTDRDTAKRVIGSMLGIEHEKMANAAWSHGTLISSDVMLTREDALLEVADSEIDELEGRVSGMNHALHILEAMELPAFIEESLKKRRAEWFAEIKDIRSGLGDRCRAEREKLNVDA